MTCLGKRAIKIAEDSGTCSGYVRMAQQGIHHARELDRRGKNEISGPFALPQGPIVGIMRPKNIRHCRKNIGEKTVQPFCKTDIELLVKQLLRLFVVANMQKLVSFDHEFNSFPFKAAA